MKKGIVLQECQGYLIVMTAVGEFCRVKPLTKPYGEGDTIEFSADQILSHSVRNRRTDRSWKTPHVFWVVAASLFLILCSIPLWNRLFPTAYASISIDINPSIELEMDRHYDVIKAKGVNNEGASLLHAVEWKKNPVVDVTEQILIQAGKRGYLAKNKDVLIVPVVLQKGAGAGSVQTLFQKSFPLLVKASNHEMTITFMVSDEKTKEQAMKANVSVGKYALYQLAKKEKKNISLDQIRTSSISDLLSALGGISKWTNAVQYKKHRMPKPSTGVSMLTEKQSLSPGSEKSAQQRQTVQHAVDSHDDPDHQVEGNGQAKANVNHPNSIHVHKETQPVLFQKEDTRLIHEKEKSKDKRTNGNQNGDHENDRHHFLKHKDRQENDSEENRHKDEGDHYQTDDHDEKQKEDRQD